MWRLSQCFPRVVASARQWNNSATAPALPLQTCRENGASHSQQQGIHTTSTYIHPIVFDDSCSNNWYYKYKKRGCYYKYKKRGYDKRKKSKKTTTDFDWDEWMHSFSSCWSTGQPRMLEAVGWGTAILLSFHLSEYYKLWNYRHVRKSSDDTNAWGVDYHLYQLATIYNSNTGGGLWNYMVPPIPAVSESPTSLTCAGDSSNDTIKHLELLEQLEDLFYSEKNILKLQNDTPPSEYERREPLDVLSDAVLTWSDLDKQYVISGCNVAARHSALHGQISEAIILWQESTTIATSNFNLGVCHELGLGVQKDLDAAVNFYRQAASQGHYKAVYNLARMYLHGHGVKQDMVKAKELLTHAAEHGITKAQSDLGVIYSTIEQDFEKAVSIFEKAVLSKDGFGLYNLGMCYQYGWGVELNLCKAADLYSQAAHQGHKMSQFMLAQFFQFGLGGLPEDDKSASSWRSYAEDTTCIDNDCDSDGDRSDFDDNPDLFLPAKTVLDHHLVASKRLFYMETSSDSDISDGSISECDLKVNSDSDSSSDESNDISITEFGFFGDIPIMANIIDNPNKNSVEKGNFGENLRLRGSFGNFNAKKRNEFIQKPNSIADFRLYSSADKLVENGLFGDSLVDISYDEVI